MGEHCSKCQRTRPTFIADPTCPSGTGYCNWVQEEARQSICVCGHTEEDHEQTPTGKFAGMRTPGCCKHCWMIPLGGCPKFRAAKRYEVRPVGTVGLGMGFKRFSVVDNKRNGDHIAFCEARDDADNICAALNLLVEGKYQNE